MIDNLYDLLVKLFDTSEAVIGILEVVEPVLLCRIICPLAAILIGYCRKAAYELLS
jgi:hypothetical protein